VLVIVLFVLTCLVAATGIGLLVEMYRRDRPDFGVGVLSTLMFAAILAVIYGALDTA
jgi:hypothetical protein